MIRLTALNPGLEHTMSTQQFQIIGLTCGHCSTAVTEEVTALTGADSAEIDLVAGGVSTLRIGSEAPVDDETVAAALAEAGDYALAGPAEPETE